MSKLLTLIIFISSFSFGQYIKEATIVLTDGTTIEARDVVYANKVYEFKSLDNLLLNQAITRDIVSELKFDSINYTETVPRIKETLAVHIKPNGLYQTIEDFYSGIPTSTEKIIGREDGGKNYNYPKDLMLFKTTDKKVVSSPFAIVYEDELYLNLKGLNKIESKEMKALYANSEAINRYIRVKYNNDDYYYTEVYQKKSKDAAILGALLFGPIGAVIGSAINTHGRDKDVFPIILLNQDRKTYQVNDCLNFNKILKDKLNFKIQCKSKEDNSLQNVRKHLIKSI